MDDSLSGGSLRKALASAVLDRMQPADHGMAAPELQGFFRQCQGILPLPWMQQENTLTVQASFAQPALRKAGWRCHQGQPARILVLAQLA